MNMTLELLQCLYTDYKRDFESLPRMSLTERIAAFAEVYHLSYYDAEWVIETGKNLDYVQYQITAMNECKIFKK